MIEYHSYSGNRKLISNEYYGRNGELTSRVRSYYQEDKIIYRDYYDPEGKRTSRQIYKYKNDGQRTSEKYDSEDGKFIYKGLYKVKPKTWKNLLGRSIDRVIKK